jgi:hypothetical protein
MSPNETQIGSEAFSRLATRHRQETCLQAWNTHRWLPLFPVKSRITTTTSSNNGSSRSLSGANTRVLLGIHRRALCSGKGGKECHDVLLTCCRSRRGQGVCLGRDSISLKEACCRITIPTKTSLVFHMRSKTGSTSISHSLGMVFLELWSFC